MVPRADPRLALRALQRAEPLGRGLWVFDASDTGNPIRRLEVPNRPPEPRAAFETRTFGPFLVVRTAVEPTGDVRSYLKLARRAQLAGKALSIADADTNLLTVLEAERYCRERAEAASRSTSLAVARSVLERGEPRRHRPLRGPPPAHCREGGEGTDHPTDQEVTQALAPRIVVHETIVRMLVCALGDLLLDVVVRLEGTVASGDDTGLDARDGGRAGRERRRVGCLSRSRREADCEARRRRRQGSPKPRSPRAASRSSDRSCEPPAA